MYRYSAFIVLYPPGLVSEAWLVWLALTEGVGAGMLYRVYLALGFLTYIPGESESFCLPIVRFAELTLGVASYIMYSHMLSQRRRTLKSVEAKR
jgi:very-long-chain (3R)-3-hydroxyacyl-CoA dehydratase